MGCGAMELPGGITARLGELVPAVEDAEGAVTEAEPEKQSFELELDAAALALLPPPVQAGLAAVLSGLHESGLLWSWRSFPVKAPHSALCHRGSGPAGIQQLFPVLSGSRPAQTSGLVKLSESQRASVRRLGVLEADSGVEKVPNVWTLTRMIQTGTLVLQKKRWQILATAFGLQMYTWPRLLHGEDFSFIEGVCLMARGGRTLVDLFLGWRWMTREHDGDDVHRRLEEMRLRQSLATLDGGGALPACRAEDAKLPASWTFTDATGAIHTLDFCYVEKMPGRSELSQKLADTSKRLQRRRRAEGTQDHPWCPMQLAELQQSEWPPVLEPLFVAVHSLVVAQQEVEQEEEAVRARAIEDIAATYPIRSLCYEFVQRSIEARVSRWREGFVRDGVQFSFMSTKLALEALRSHPLGERLAWWVHLLEHELAWRVSPDRDRERRLLDQKFVPEKEINFYFIIWLPKNWIIESHTHHTSKVTYYAAKKTRTCSLTTRIPGWRIQAAGVVCAEAFNNGCYYLCVSLVHGPLGVKALFYRRRFYPATRVNARTGQLEEDSSIAVETLCSRFAALWSGIMKSRQAFEDAPDTGLLGKVVTRIFNLVWNYLFRGLVGTILIVLGQSLLTLLNVPVSIVLLATPILWAPIASLLVYFFCIFIYDGMEPHDTGFCCQMFPFLAGLVQIIAGLLQLLLCLITTCLLPVLNALFAFLRLLLNCFWWSYDSLMFCIVIRRCARVPDSDSFACRRTSGPGLATNFYYQISPAIALLALQYQLETIELQLHESRLRRLALQPEKDLEEALSKFIVSPFGLGKVISQVADASPIGHVSQTDDNNLLAQKQMKHLRKTCQATMKQIDKVFGARRTELQQRFGLGDRRMNASLIRQSQADAQRVRQWGTEIVRTFAERRWLPMLTEKEAAEFWDKRDLLEGDWGSLAQSLLEQAFSKEFFSSTFETMEATGFRLEVTHAGLEGLVSSLLEADASVQDPLSSVSPVCPSVASKPKLEAEVHLPSMLHMEPNVSVEALRKVYRREEGWGAA